MEKEEPWVLQIRVRLSFGGKINFRPETNDTANPLGSEGGFESTHIKNRFECCPIMTVICAVIKNAPDCVGVFIDPRKLICT